MEYALVVLTHGEGDTLVDTLATFYEMVTPAPVLDPIFEDPGDLGFCRMVEDVWSEASQLDVEYVFWLEHDFRFIRPVEMTLMARMLEENLHLAQMALIRSPVSDEEKAAGSWLSRHKKSLNLRTVGTYVWFEHSICFTTNPSLIRREFMAENPWPDYPSQCEERFSEDLRERGYSFGSWGTEAQVQHTGALRTGHGY